MIRKVLLSLFTFSFVAGVQPLLAQKKTDSLEKVLTNKSLEDTTRVLVLNQLGNIYLQNDSAKAVATLQRAYRLAVFIEYKKGIALTTKNYGILYEYAGDYKKALEFYGRALEIFKEIKNNPGIADAYNNFGVIYYLEGIYDKALYYYLEAEKVLRSQSDPVFYSNILNNIGLIYDKQKQYDKALTYFKDALNIRKQHNIHNKISSSYNNIGLLYQNLGKLDLALENHLKAKQIREQENDLKALGATLNNIADVLLQQKKFIDAHHTFNEALAIKEKVGDRRGQSYSLLGIAETCFEEGNYPESIKKGELALAIARQMDLKDHLINVYLLLANVHEKLQNPKDALYYLHEAMACKDSVYQKSQRENIAEMAVRFDLEKSQREQLQMEQNIREKNKELSRSNNIVRLQSIMVIVISLALLTTSVLIYKLRKTIKERDKLNKVKDHLFAIISHDYRSPLTSVKSSLNLFTLKNVSQEEQQQLVRMSLNEISNTLNFLDNMLLWANAQLKGIRVNKIPFNLVTIIESNIELLQPQAEYKKLNLKLEKGNEVEVAADREMVNTVMRNLISNSIKFSDDYNEIVVKYSIEESMVTVHVIDQGVGIRAERLPDIFKFEKATSTYGTRNEKGIGLGLSLCKDFVEKNDGIIGVKSEFGAGSDFFFTIPLVI